MNQRDDFSARSPVGIPSLGDVHESEMQRLAELFRQYRRAILVCFASSIGSILLLVTLLPQQYTAEARLLLTSPGTNIGNMQDVLPKQGVTEEALLNSQEILRSRGFAEQLAQSLSLDRDPAFLSESGGGIFGKAVSWVLELLQPRPSDEAPEEPLRLATDAILENLTVKTGDAPGVLVLRYAASDAERAASITNAAAGAFIVRDANAQVEEAKRAHRWLQRDIDVLRQQVAERELQIERARLEAGRLESEQFPIISEQISRLTEQIANAAGDRAGAEARLEEIEALVAAGQVEAVSAVLQSEAISRLRPQEADMIRRLAELTTEFGPRHPRVLQAKQQMADLAAAIAAEVRRIVVSQRNALQSARAREVSLQRDLADLKDQLYKANRAGVAIKRLEDEVSADRSLLQKFLQRARETEALSDVRLHTSGVEIISHAVVPRKPSFPNVPLLLAFALIGATALSLLVISVLEALNRGVRYPQEVDKLFGRHPVAFLPYQRSCKGRWCISAPRRAAVRAAHQAEAVQSLALHLLPPGLPEQGRVFLISSALSGEGKTSLAIALAHAFSHKRVLLVDGDLRSRALSKALGYGNAPGLVDYVNGSQALNRLYRHDVSEMFSVLAAGKLNAPPDGALLERLSETINLFRDRFDVTIVDSPPLLAVPDGKALAREVDAVVFVLRWNHAPREVLAEAFRSARSMCSVVLPVLNMIGSGAPSTYYWDDAYYARKAEGG